MFICIRLCIVEAEADPRVSPKRPPSRQKQLKGACIIVLSFSRSVSSPFCNNTLAIQYQILIIWVRSGVAQLLNTFFQKITIGFVPLRRRTTWCDVVTCWWHVFRLYIIYPSSSTFLPLSRRKALALMADDSVLLSDGESESRNQRTQPCMAAANCFTVFLRKKYIYYIYFCIIQPKRGNNRGLSLWSSSLLAKE